jgi:hypothetical protein
MEAKDSGMRACIWTLRPIILDICPKRASTSLIAIETLQLRLSPVRSAIAVIGGESCR